jgi:hypothetical protein
MPGSGLPVVYLPLRDAPEAFRAGWALDRKQAKVDSDAAAQAAGVAAGGGMRLISGAEYTARAALPAQAPCYWAIENRQLGNPSLKPEQVRAAATIYVDATTGVLQP